MVKERQSRGGAGVTTQEQEELTPRIYQRLHTKMHEELLAMAQLMAANADHETFGQGEFEPRDKRNQVRTTIVSEAANERSKKGVPR